MLLKGNGLCHGITGSSYVLHSLYRATRDPKWLQRCYRMTLALAEEDIQSLFRHHKDRSRLVRGCCDTPFSLMEGMGGDLALLCDLLSTDSEVRFPGYELLF